MIVAFAVLTTVPALAQVTLQRIPNASPRPINPSARDIRVQASKDAKMVETPELCTAHNAYLKNKIEPALRSQLAQLQSMIADHKHHTFMCAADGSHSVSGDGVTTDCGSYACNPLDGLCRTKAKTSFDCASGFNWVPSGGCVPAH